MDCKDIHNVHVDGGLLWCWSCMKIYSHNKPLYELKWDNCLRVKSAVSEDNSDTADYVKKWTPVTPDGWQDAIDSYKDYRDDQIANQILLGAYDEQ